MAGALSSVYLLPETQTAIIILSNTFALRDAPDWIAQPLVEVILDSPKRNDFVDLSENAAENSLGHQPNTQKILAKERVIETSHRELNEYTGRYYKSIGNPNPDIAISGDGLRMITQGFPYVHYDLYRYNYDVFAWDCDREKESHKTIYPQWAPNFHRISFLKGKSGKIKKLGWGFGGGKPEGEEVLKEIDQPVCLQRLTFS
jgi:hypothetical protein